MNWNLLFPLPLRPAKIYIAPHWGPFLDCLDFDLLVCSDFSFAIYAQAAYGDASRFVQAPLAPRRNQLARGCDLTPALDCVGAQRLPSSILSPARLRHLRSATSLRFGPSPRRPASPPVHRIAATDARLRCSLRLATSQSTPVQ
jgi:hypothetical protein